MPPRVARQGWEGGGKEAKGEEGEGRTEKGYK